MDLITDIKAAFLELICVFYQFITNAFNLRKKCESNARLDGKVVLITGANTGIGKETAHRLSLRGAKIIIGCRDIKKAESAVNQIKMGNPKANIVVMKLDLSSLSSVRQFAKEVSQQEPRLDLLINNAGVMKCPEWKTEDGFEMQFGTNHLGHFLLTLSLLDILKKSSNARIINVSSTAHMTGKIHFNNINLRNNAYSPSKAYKQSKLANILFTRELARRLGRNSNISCYSLHPGIISSDLWRHSSNSLLMKVLTKLFFIDVVMGSQTTLYCALEDSIQSESGFYYDDCRRVDDKCMVSRATDDESADKLWELSSDLVKLEDHLKIERIK